MVKVGVSARTEKHICKQKTAKRVQGIWDPTLIRQKIQLEDGRFLTYFLDGPRTHCDNSVEERKRRQQIPHIFVFHAAFLSGNSFLMQEAPKDYVLVCVNRPGYWGSDPAPEDFTYQDFAHDMEQLANHLQVTKFFVAGHSSGGPCALACAACLPERVQAIGLLSSDPEYAHESAPDKAFTNEVLLGKLLPFMLEKVIPFVPTSQNARRGLKNDYRLEMAQYPFCTEEISHPTLIYVGENDSILPPSIAEHLHERIPNSTLTIVPEAGHLDLLEDQTLQPFFNALLQAPKSTPAGKLECRESSQVTLLSPLAAEATNTTKPILCRGSTASTDDLSEITEFTIRTTSIHKLERNNDM